MAGNLNWFDLGTPFGLEIKSSSRGLYKHTYNLTWTMKSFVSLEETEISYRRKVRKVGQQSQP